MYVVVGSGALPLASWRGRGRYIWDAVSGALGRDEDGMVVVSGTLGDEGGMVGGMCGWRCCCGEQSRVE